MFELPTDEQKKNQYDYTNEDEKIYYQNNASNQQNGFLKSFQYENDEEEDDDDDDDDLDLLLNRNIGLKHLIEHFSESLQQKRSKIGILNGSIRVKNLNGSFEFECRIKSLLFQRINLKL